MAQHDYSIANQTFPSTRSDINNALSAIGSLNSGTSAPSTTFAGMLWYDTTNGVIKQRNAADSAWVTLWTDDLGGFVSQDGASIYAADAGASDSYSITLSPAPASLTTGMHVFFKANTANTGAATLNVNGLGAVAIKKYKDVDVQTGDIKAGQLCLLEYDGTNWQLLSAVSNEYFINQQSAVTTLQAADQLPFADNSDSDKNKKITVENLRASLINDATAETTVNDADTILIYDASASAPRKMTRANFLAGVTGGIEVVDTVSVSSPVSSVVLDGLNGGHEYYQLEYDGLVPSVDGTKIHMQYSVNADGSSPESGASDYWHDNMYPTGAGEDSSDTEIDLGYIAQGNASEEDCGGSLRLMFNGTKLHAKGVLDITNTSSNRITQAHSSKYMGSASIRSLVIYCATGNITDGSFKLIGVG